MPRLHPLASDFEQPKKFNCPFCYEPHPLAQRAAKALQQRLPTLDEGKMFGVLVTEDADGNLGFLAAYSGQTDAFKHEGDITEDDFVPPVFDYLQPDGYFKQHEAQISELNRQITAQENSSELKVLNTALRTKNDAFTEEINRFRTFMAEAKQLRDEQRTSGRLTESEELSLIKESQFQKAELRRMKKRFQEELEALQQKINAHETLIAELRKERKRRSDALQQWLFDEFKIADSHGQLLSLSTIFNDSIGKNPPSGAGECCEPKLLHYAFTHHLQPLTMAMFWWGESPAGEIRHHKTFYPACQSKCKPLLSWMLRDVAMEENPLEKFSMKSLKIIYEDDSIAVINKPEGLLSIPGRCNAPDVYSILRKAWGETDSPIMVHRLDMDTSGIMVVAKTREAHRILQQQFEHRQTEKVYVALLEHDFPMKAGKITLPLRKDLNDTPRQMVDFENGKASTTLYRVLGETNGHTRIELHPLTGRTHQLRMHCAHQQGLNNPIWGDRLYGHSAARLYLHAQSLTFSHPLTGQRMTFECLPDF